MLENTKLKLICCPFCTGCFDFNIFIFFFPLVILRGLPLLAPRWLLCDFTVIKSIVNCFIIPDSNSLFPLILLLPLQQSCGTDPQEVRERATVLQTKFEDHVHSSERTVRWAKKGQCVSVQLNPEGLTEAAKVFFWGRASGERP